MKKLNIGLIGCGFMGRTHSNAFSQVNHFFDFNTTRAQSRLRPQQGHRPRLRRQMGL
jgi:predicted dehydrogenase